MKKVACGQNSAQALFTVVNAALLMLVQVQLYPFSTPGVGQRIASKPVKEVWASLAGKRETCREVHFGCRAATSPASSIMDKVRSEAPTRPGSHDTNATIYLDSVLSSIGESLSLRD